MGFSNVGQVWTPESLADYLQSLSRPSWIKGITLHHCSEPSLAQRPKGLSSANLNSLRDFYSKEKGWSSGPHLFIDEDQIFGMCPFSEKGVHAVSFNKDHIGIEVLGDYDSEDPHSGRGLDCWTNCFACVKVLLDWLGLPNSSVNFHRDDPKTTKTCPGTKVTKNWVMESLGSTVAPVPAPQAVSKQWELFVSGASIGKYDEAAGKIIVPTRDIIPLLGGDANKLSFNSTSKKGSYNGNPLDDSFVVGGHLMSPIREIATAVGASIDSVDLASRKVQIKRA